MHIWGNEKRIKMIYLDNAATTMRKPQEVIDAITAAMCSMGNAGRGVNEASLGAARTVYERCMIQEKSLQLSSERKMQDRLYLR